MADCASDSSSGLRRADNERETRRFKIGTCKTNVGDSGASVVFTCARSWPKSIGMKRGITCCPAHCMTDADFVEAKEIKPSARRLALDSMLERLGVENKPDKKGERRLCNMHSPRRGGGKVCYLQFRPG